MSEDVHVKAGNRCVKSQNNFTFRCAPIEDLKKDIAFVDDKGNIVELDTNIKASDFADVVALWLSKKTLFKTEGREEWLIMEWQMVEVLSREDRRNGDEFMEITTCV
eukprot:GHVS01002200.1.p1 GENE.GHVS01002200.1~~GHVS01002200.1.p1  ORF type:complete len:125 (-),score=15.15 GHVS01002200.1:629-949(-)